MNETLLIPELFDASTSGKEVGRENVDVFQCSGEQWAKHLGFDNLSLSDLLLLVGLADQCVGSSTIQRIDVKRIG